MAYDEELADRIRELIPDRDGVREKKMFGGLAFLVGGHIALAAGSKGGLMLPCEPEVATTLRTRPGVGPMVMRGKDLEGWLRVEARAVETDEQLAEWVRLGVDHARTLPPHHTSAAGS